MGVSFIWLCNKTKNNYHQHFLPHPVSIYTEKVTKHMMLYMAVVMLYMAGGACQTGNAICTGARLLLRHDAAGHGRDHRVAGD